MDTGYHRELKLRISFGKMDIPGQMAQEGEPAAGHIEKAGQNEKDTDNDKCFTDPHDLLQRGSFLPLCRARKSPDGHRLPPWRSVPGAFWK